MSGRRRLQRSVRITVAVALLGIVALVVMLAVATSTGPAVAAVLALAGGVLATRIMHTEVLQTRGDAARQRAAQAKAFGSELSAIRREHRGETELLTQQLTSRSRELTSRNQRIHELQAAVRGSETRASQSNAQLEQETRRADEAQGRLSELLDQVLAQSSDRPRMSVDRPGDSEGPVLPAAASARSEVNELDAEVDALFGDDRLPSVVDLLTWEAGAQDPSRVSHRRRPA